MNEEITLKPCLHCGGTAELKHVPLASISRFLDDSDIKDLALLSYIECTNCGARSGNAKISNAYASDVKAAELWNAEAGAEPEPEPELDADLEGGT